MAVGRKEGHLGYIHTHIAGADRHKIGCHDKHGLMLTWKIHTQDQISNKHTSTGYSQQYTSKHRHNDIKHVHGRMIHRTSKIMREKEEDTAPFHSMQNHGVDRLPQSTGLSLPETPGLSMPSIHILARIQ